MSLPRRAVTALLRPFGVRVVTLRGGPLAGSRLALDLAYDKAYWLGRYEPEVAEIIATLDVDGATVWDVGANIGYFSLLLAGRGAQVVALEANAGTAARLRQNADLNGARVEVVEAAVAGESGEVSFEAITGRRRAESRIVSGGGVRVRALTLDDLLAQFGAPAFVKMDVEGAELPALRAAPRLLAAQPKLLIEVHRERDAGALTALLDDAGYDVSWTGWRILATP